MPHFLEIFQYIVDTNTSGIYIGKIDVTKHGGEDDHSSKLCTRARSNHWTLLCYFFCSRRQALSHQGHTYFHLVSWYSPFVHGYTEF